MPRRSRKRCRSCAGRWGRSRACTTWPAPWGRRRCRRSRRPSSTRYCARRSRGRWRSMPPPPPTRSTPSCWPARSRRRSATRGREITPSPTASWSTSPRCAKPSAWAAGVRGGRAASLGRSGRMADCARSPGQRRCSHAFQGWRRCRRRPGSRRSIPRGLPRARWCWWRRAPRSASPRGCPWRPPRPPSLPRRAQPRTRPRRPWSRRTRPVRPAVRPKRCSRIFACARRRCCAPTPARSIRRPDWPNTASIRSR